ncbi:TB2/DP1/HVA22-related protein [Gracilaria domingensis]|nr:TB2/DP1/HVA22-related protein [Gracilaria domingensis]
MRLFYTRTSTRVRTSYRLFLSEIRAKSKLAALATPHIIFICLAFLFHSTIGKRLSYFLQGARLLVLACIRPAVRTALLLYTVDIEAHPETASTHVSSAPASAVDSSLDASRERVPRRRRRATTPARRRRSSASSPDDARDTARSNSRVNRSLSVSNGALDNSSSISTLWDIPQSEKEHEALELATLRFWVVFALAWATRSLIWYFCPARFEGFLSEIDNFLLYFLLWSDLDITKGAETIYALVSRTARSRTRRRGQSRLEKLNVILRVLVATGVVNADHAEDFSTVVAESGLALLGAVFLITPRMVTFLGTVAVGFILPCYLSQGVIESRDTKSFYRHNWLSYWNTLYLLEIAYTATVNAFGWLPLWYHIKLGVLLWLQLPYFRGATIVLDRVMAWWGKTMSSMQRQVVTPRKKKRA